MPGRLLFVHAHPDDESINNGATMAHYVGVGAEVTLVTCTRGERGEVIPPELAHLAGDDLGRHRKQELAAAMSALGVGDHRFLGEPDERFVDSGMAYAPDGHVVPAPDTPDGAFAVTEADRTAELLAAVVREVRPHVVVTYEPGGGYGHPDHVRAHDVTVRALELAAADWDVPKLYWVVVPDVAARAGLRAIGENPDRPLPSMAVPAADVTTCLEAGPLCLDAKVAALRAHATQIVVAADASWYALSNHVRSPLVGQEYYQLARGALSAPFDATGRESDLLAGVDT